MPNYRSINIALHSQFDVETLPEYYPAPRGDYLDRGITGFTPELISDDTSTCSVYIPVLPGSTFWISYSVSPPVPDGHYFLFKLYINGAHIVSWSAGREESWKGKTMFGLYERLEEEEGKMKVEKRVLCFTPPNKSDGKWNDVTDVFDESACVMIKVHRANGRKRREREMEEYDKTQHARDVKGVNLVNAGRAGAKHPKRFYKFSLIDPVDQPFATFRYYYRTWDQLQNLGLLDEEWNGDAGEDNDLSIIEPNEASVLEVEGNSSSHVLSKESNASRPLPTIPQKSDASSSTAYRPDPAYPVDDWIVRTPSPARPARESTNTELLKSKQDHSFSASSLMNMVSCTWKRRRTRNAAACNDTDTSDGA
ncbi:Nn.00g027430.m01.CDS01 [Neocucurbitaria sp. VM-36]